VHGDPGSGEVGGHFIILHHAHHMERQTSLPEGLSQIEQKSSASAQFQSARAGNQWNF
jgi:hypothetical protein